MDFTEAAARHALSEATQATEVVGVENATLIRLGSNAVFRLANDVVARVAPRIDLLENARKQVRVAEWLAFVGYSAMRTIDVTQPVEVDGRVVTFWVSINNNEVFASIADVAALIRQLHNLDEPDFELPPLVPFGDVGDPAPVFSGLPAGAAEFLRDQVMWAREEFPQLSFALASGPIHGDANVGNVLQDEEGNAVLIDLDSFAVGPREWDLIQTALFYDRLGWHTEEEYRTFVEVYGYDIMRWSGYETLADMREIAMTSWLSQKAHESEATAREAEKRVRAMMTGASRRDWGAY